MDGNELESHDVRAHLIGGVPVSEVEVRSTELQAVGLDRAVLFVPATEPSQLSLFDQRPEPLVDEAYLAFRQELADRCDLASAVRSAGGVRARRTGFEATCGVWWAEQACPLIDRAARQSVGRLRKGLVDGLVAALTPVGLLDASEVRTAGEMWWAATEVEVRTLRAQGAFLPVLQEATSDGGLFQDIPLLEERARADVLARWGGRLMDVLNAEADNRLDGVIALVEHWWTKYRVSLRTLEIRRSEAKARLDALLHELGYV
ncbi:MAG: hypothetical protein MUF84_05010 [Anaerolineae bacterium]|nr:hypothetical protein [Anaerolineae bacterium]